MNDKYYYAEGSTKDVLISSRKKVYLYGGFGGYNNFGDIIQLKNTIVYHRQNTEFEPVIILHLSSLENPEHVNEFKKWFNCDNLLFISDKYVDAGKTTLELVDKVSAGSILHVYGGGFLNRFWGESIIEKIKHFIKTFELSTYLFSGQQIDEKTTPSLDVLFKEVGHPYIFGVRDLQSLEHMKATALDAGKIKFSFDDVTETFQLWRDKTKPSLKVKLINKVRPKQIMWHINTSTYATASKNKVLDRINKAKIRFPKNKVLLAHIYNDIRHSLRDTLQSVVQMENRFPYHEYRVVNLAQMALDLQVEKDVYPAIGSVLDSVEVAVASSYHITMFAHFFGIPAFLMSENDFYNQKQKSLGLGSDYDAFLDNIEGSLNTYEDEIKAREKWLNSLNTVMAELSKKSNNTKIKDIAYETQSEAEELMYRGVNS